MELIDTHAHLDAFPAPQELLGAIERARRANVSRIITCSAKKSDWAPYSGICAKHKGEIFWQLGVHPAEIDGETPESLQEDAQKYLSGENPPVSIGEIGLDFYRFEGSAEEFEKMKSRQERLFFAQLEIAKAANLPVCVHARSAVKEAIKIIDLSGANWNKIVFHCFSGDLHELEEINSRGGRASFTGIITYKNADMMRSAMLKQGLEKIMFETDCPYLAPAPNRGMQNEPSYIPFIAQKAAELFGASLEEIAAVSTKNAREFFGI
ncbi:MAG: TatD family hydrolase [Opitutales bacterium]|nr:TatD family hydrolase [Opitutales bacterium]